MSIPQEIKVNGTPKSLLKKVIKGIIPDNIINRPKQGFSAPIGKWLCGVLARQVREALLEGKLRRQGFFDYSYV
jgi:asparagine synthase (glutamine-hydrolysing)